MTDLCYLSAVEAGAQMRLRALSPVDLTRALLDRISRLDRKLHAYIIVLEERAIAQAHQAEAELANGRWRGPLHGIPLALKDLIDTNFAATTGGMAVQAARKPERSATLVRKLETAGAIVLGKLAMTEGAFTRHHPSLPTPVNPWNAEYWTGVSSSGAGVAVAAGLAVAAIGSDTGGSIRFPSACCGVTGLKPTWGRISRAGVMPLAETLDHVGPMTRCASDAALLLDVLAGPDPHDATALSRELSD